MSEARRLHVGQHTLARLLDLDPAVDRILSVAIDAASCGLVVTVVPAAHFDAVPVDRTVTVTDTTYSGGDVGPDAPIRDRVITEHPF